MNNAQNHCLQMNASARDTFLSFVCKEMFRNAFEIQRFRVVIFFYETNVRLATCKISVILSCEEPSIVH